MLFRLLNEEIIEEYINVLERPKFGFDKNEIFYAIVMEKRKQQEAYLVTGNKKHFPEKAFIVTPREMLSIMRMTYENC